MLTGLAEHDALPWFWEQAPLPRPQLWLQRGKTLRRLAPEEPLPAGAAALSALSEWPEGRTALLRDSAGALWRLRPCAALDGCRLWQAQSVEQSRVLLFDELRATLGRVLAETVRHELAAPLQTIAFNADIAERLAGTTGDERFTANLKGIKPRVRELQRRQVAAVALWLAGPPDLAALTPLREVLDEVQAMLQGYLGILGTPLQPSGLPLLDGVLLPGPAQKLRIGWLALLVMAGSRASRRTGGESRGLRLGVARQAGVFLELDESADAAALGPWFATLGDAAAMAAAAVLLEEAGLELLPQDGRGIRLEVHALRQEECTRPGSGVTPRLSRG